MFKIAISEALGELNTLEKKNAPSEIYYEGKLELLRTSKRVSVIGARKVSDNGRNRAERISKILVDYGITVVSGLAEGVDTIAHQTAIQNGGNTIAVIGTSLDKSYPKENRDLQNLIKSKHLCISQFSVGYPSLPKNFVRRNKTMALISDATIIVEAAEKSGTRHQGWEALRLGRTVLLMENLLKEESISWAKEMIEYGAQILTRDNYMELLENISNFNSKKKL